MPASLPRIGCARGSQPLKSPITATCGGIRRPDCELRSVAEDMRAELFVQARVRPLAEQVEVVAGQSYWAVKGLA